MGSVFQWLCDAVTSPQFIWWTLWGGLALLTLALVALMQTRWGQSQPLRKCAMLSLWVHLLLATYAASVRIVTQPVGTSKQVSIRVVDLDGATEEAPGNSASQARPWESLATAVPPLPAADEPPRPQSASPSLERWTPQQVELPPTDVRLPLDAAAEAPLRPAEPTQLDAPADTPGPTVATVAAPIMPPEAKRRDPESPDVPAAAPLPRPYDVAEATAASLSPQSPRLPPPLVHLERLSPLPQVADAARSPSPQALAAGPDDVLGTAANPRPPETISLESQQPHTADTDPPQGPVAPPRLVERPVGSSSGADTLSTLGMLARPQLAEPTHAADAGRLAAPPRAGLAAEASTGEVPDLYRLRMSPDRGRVAIEHGGSAQTEAAVTAALTWLAANQSADGRWDARTHGGGREHRVLGHDRQGAGARADTGITGLALLAFLGAGHTHRRGDYTETVAGGINYLLSVQADDGNLAGSAELFAFMYCHGMATLALSEAFGMTGDPRLEVPLRRALHYTVAGQHRTTGGWRYRPGDTGDTSQLGWQLMALKSADLAGIATPLHTRDGMARFLRSVSGGRAGGLASYRPGERPSRTMTAEALVCRQFLGLGRDDPAAREAGDFLLGELPGTGQPNFYYWYYGTLAMYQIQGGYWDRWNEALTATLLASQRSEGPLAGSWDPSDVWGGYGGRVYSTALPTLCLEVYYRFLPLYVEAASLGPGVRR